MSQEPVICANDISMCFNLAEEKTDTLKEYFLKITSGKLHYQSFYALQDVSFSIEKGDSVALIGVNGSGKSTLLKIIAGVYKPTSGSISVHGTIAPLIELGAGFDMELTGKENIFLNGAILGYSHKFMDQHFDSIVEFAELKDFINVPVKNYSSGMIARLGFSIATFAKSDILIIDEVLAVGDYKFQEKCKGRITELLEDGTTLLFVSHNAAQVRELCKKSILLDHGKLINYGETETVLNQYMEYC